MCRMATDEKFTTEHVDYWCALYADSPRLARALLPRVPRSPEWENVKRQLRTMRDEYRCVRLETADRLCICLGIHPVLAARRRVDDMGGLSSRKAARKRAGR
jgi:hypothetical protein